MPTLEASRSDFETLCGIRAKGRKEMEELLMYAKAELDSLENDEMKIDEKDTNRPDLWSIEGIAREIRLRTGKQKGIPKYRVAKSGLKVKIEKSVLEARPLTACAVLRGVKVTDEFLRQMIQLQEKVSTTFGRRRKEAAIGIYDYDKIHGNIRYYGAEPRGTKFIPLEFTNALDLDEILELHPKGREFGQLLKGQKRYPIFEDDEGNILSMPPIINSSYSGKVTESTKNLFIEVSGFKEETIDTALNVMATSIAERGGKVFSVDVIYPNGRIRATPALAPKKTEVSLERIRKVSGLELKDKEIKSLLEKAGYHLALKGKKLACSYPAYRNDIMHEVDVIEDAVIGYGYNRIGPLEIKLAVYGSQNEEESLKDRFAELCLGMGLQEVITFTLTSKEKQCEKALCSDEKIVEIANPVSLSWAVLRRQIFPELLEFLAKNKDAEYPHKIFELGKTVQLNPSKETGVDEKNALCIALSSKEANYTSVKSVFDSIKENSGLNYEVKESSAKFLEEGKGADILLNGKCVGFVGEVDRKVLSNFSIKMPVALLEMEI